MIAYAILGTSMHWNDGRITMYLGKAPCKDTISRTPNTCAALYKSITRTTRATKDEAQPFNLERVR